MKNRKILSLLVIMVMVLSVFTGCAPKPAAPAEAAPAPVETAKWADGLYFAAADAFDAKTGWKEVIKLEVKDGKILTVDWNGISVNGGTDKKTASIDGKYPMVEKGGAKAPYHEQAAAMEAYLIEKQDPKAINLTDADGHTDSVSGVSIKVGEFSVLAEKALAAGPVVPGAYKDGTYHAESPAFDEKSGWKSTLDITVYFGNIMSVNWNGLHKDGGDDKKTASKGGKYPMVEKGGAKAPWHEQAAAMEAFLIEKQDVAAINLTDADGHTDAVSSVSIKVNDFTTLATEALATAK